MRVGTEAGDMHKPGGAGLACMSRYSGSGLHVNGVERVAVVLRIQADRIHHPIRAAHRPPHRRIVTRVRTNEFQPGRLIAKDLFGAFRMTRDHPHAERAAYEMPDDAAAEKPRTAEHRDLALLVTVHG